MEQNKTSIFAGEGHKNFFCEKWPKCKRKDRWHRALIYALGLTENIRNHFKEVYDIEDDIINRDSLKAGWVTGMDARVIRLAFTLFTDYVPEDETKEYMPWNIFDYGLVPFLIQALALRFEN